MVSIRKDYVVTLCLGALFICLGSLRTLLIKFSENAVGHYDYVPVTVNVCAELLKLVVCSGLAIRVIVDEFKSGKGVLCGGREDILDFMKWSIPGLLYFLDNLIAFYTMEYFQPALVVLLGNFYIITTSLLFRLILKRRFSRAQWTAIFILFMSIMLLSLQTSGALSVDHHKSHHAMQPHSMAENTDSMSSNNSAENGDVLKSEKRYCSSSAAKSTLHSAFHSDHKVSGNSSAASVLMKRDHTLSAKTLRSWQHKFKFNFHEGHVLVLFQCLVSSTANVYNEKIFKENGGLQESIYVQNSKLYLFGLVFNGATLLIHNGYRNRVLRCGLFSGHNYFSLALIAVTAMYGLTVALIFKFRDNMFHVLSTQVTTVLVITASIYYFGFDPQLEFFLAAPIVLAAIYLFNISRVKGDNMGGELEVGLGEEGLRLGRDDLDFRHQVEEVRPLVPVLDQNED